MLPPQPLQRLREKDKAEQMSLRAQTKRDKKERPDSAVIGSPIESPRDLISSRDDSPDDVVSQQYQTVELRGPVGGIPRPVPMERLPSDLVCIQFRSFLLFSTVSFVFTIFKVIYFYSSLTFSSARFSLFFPPVFRSISSHCFAPPSPPCLPCRRRRPTRRSARRTPPARA